MTRMTIETTLARAEARAAEERWVAHKFGCPRCSEAQHIRKPERMCDYGTELYAGRNSSMRQLQRERELDRLPIDGQGELFAEAEIAAMKKAAERKGGA